MRIPEGIAAVYFDAVGTLLFPDPPAPQVYAEVGRKYGSCLNKSEILPRFHAAFQCEEELDSHDGLRTSEAREVERWRRIVAQVLDDVTDSEACFQELFAHFGEAKAWSVNEEAELVLTELSQRGYRLGMASNYDQRLHGVIAGKPELQSIERLVISSQVGWRKPAPGFFAAMQSQSSLSGEQILHVGDDRINDYQGAKQAGLFAVLLDGREKAHEPGTVRIRKLSELLG